MSVIGTEMSLAEAARLADILRADPSSAIAAAAEGWEYPISREAAVLMDSFDAFAKVNFKKPKPYPRPFVKGETTRHGNAAGRTPEQVKAILRGQFGQPEAPV